MFYMPILKIRAGEMGALHVTSRDNLRPLLEIQPTPVAEEPPPGEERKAQKTPTEHLNDQLKKIEVNWGTAPVHLDYDLFLEGHAGTDGIERIDTLAEDARQVGTRLIPVVRPGKSSQRVALARRIARKHHEGYGLRVCGQALESSDLRTEIDGLIELLDTRYGLCDLIIDWGDLSSPSRVPTTNRVNEILAPLQKDADWRSITIAGGAFPASNPSQVPEALLPRRDAALWREVRQFHPDVCFGDYGADATTFGIKPVPSLATLLKYTLHDSWLFLREQGIPAPKDEAGNKTGKGSKGDFRVLCRKLVSGPHFMGEGFSWGDAYLSDRQTADTGGGGAERRQAMFAHHFAVVLNELGALGAQSASPTMPADDELPF